MKKCYSCNLNYEQIHNLLYQCKILPMQKLERSNVHLLKALLTDYRAVQNYPKHYKQIF